MAVDRISCRNGLVGSAFFGFRNLHDDALKNVHGSAAEDVERSCRYFARDGVVLRYLMYCVQTVPRAESGLGPFSMEPGERRALEEQAMEDIAAEFPQLLGLVRTAQDTINLRFKPEGKPPLCANGLFATSTTLQ